MENIAADSREQKSTYQRINPEAKKKQKAKKKEKKKAKKAALLLASDPQVEADTSTAEVALGVPEAGAESDQAEEAPTTPSPVPLEPVVPADDEYEDDEDEASLSLDFPLLSRQPEPLEAISIDPGDAIVIVNTSQLACEVFSRGLTSENQRFEFLGKEGTVITKGSRNCRVQLDNGIKLDRLQTSSDSESVLEKFEFI